jgi:hypothetical protein
MGNGKSNGHRHTEMNNLPPWRRKEIELRQKNMLKTIKVDNYDSIPEEVKDKKIFFWSWTLQKVSVNNYSKLFIAHTHRNVGFDGIYERIHKQHPDWLVTRFKMLQLHRNMYIPAPFFIAHAIEIRTPERVLWGDMIVEVTDLLRGLL